MNKILHIILITLFSFTIISCAKKEESKSSSSSSGTTSQMGGSRQGVELSLSTVVTTLAGTAGDNGSANGTGTSASFYLPYGITTDGTNLYVGDGLNHQVRQIVISTGVVTTVAGTGDNGSSNGTGTAASFYYPLAITTDGTNLYVGEYANHLIRKIE